MAKTRVQSENLFNFTRPENFLRLKNKTGHRTVIAIGIGG